MKKIVKIVLVLFFTIQANAVPSVVNVINATTNYTLYYNVKLASKVNCYNIITASKVTGTYNYLSLPANSSLAFNTFNQLSSLYGGGLNFLKQTSASSTVSASLANANSHCLSAMNAFQYEWAGFIYKVENTTSTEGGWMRFDDFGSCLGAGYEEYVSYTNTEAYTTYTIGGERYFVVSNL